MSALTQNISKTGRVALLLNAYLDVRNAVQLATDLSQGGPKLRDMMALLGKLRSAVAQQVSGKSPGMPGFTCENVMQFCVEVQNGQEVLTEWLRCCAPAFAAVSPVEHVINGKSHLCIKSREGEYIMLPLTAAAQACYPLPSLNKGAASQRLAALFEAENVKENDGHQRAAELLCARATKVAQPFEAQAGIGHVLWALHLCPDLLPKLLLATPTASEPLQMALDNLIRASQNQIIETFAENLQTPRIGFTHAAAWCALVTLCKLGNHASHGMLREILNRAFSNISIIIDHAYQSKEDLLRHLPANILNPSQIISLGRWYATNRHKHGVDTNLLDATRTLLHRIASSGFEDGRNALSTIVVEYTRHNNWPSVFAIVDLYLPGPLPDMTPELAATLTLNIPSKYLQHGKATIQGALEILASSNEGLSVVETPQISRWHTLLQAEGLAPVIALLLHRSYLHGRTRPTRVADVWQAAVVKGKDLQTIGALKALLTREMLPSGSNMALRLRMALAARVPRTPKERLRELQVTLSNLDLSIHDSVVRAGGEPQPSDFLRQELSALLPLDEAAIRSIDAHALSPATLGRWCTLLERNLLQNIDELLILIEIMCLRDGFSQARPVLQRILELYMGGELSPSTREKVRTCLRTWSGRAPSQLKGIVQSLGKFDFEENLKSLRAAGRAKAARDKQMVDSQARLQTLAEIELTIAKLPAQEKAQHIHAVSNVLPEILLAMDTAAERRALSAFLPQLSLVGLPKDRVRALSLIYGRMASNDKMLDAVATLIKQTLRRHATSEPAESGVGDALNFELANRSWTRAMRLFSLEPEMLPQQLSLASAALVVTEAPVSLLRGQKTLVAHLLERLRDPELALETAPWNDGQRWDVLLETLNTVSLALLLERTGAPSDHEAVAKWRAMAISRRHLDELELLVNRGSQFALTRQSSIYWNAYAARAHLTNDPTKLLRQLSGAFDSADRQAVAGQEALAFLRNILMRLRGFQPSADLDWTNANTDLTNWRQLLDLVPATDRDIETLVLAELTFTTGAQGAERGVTEDLLTLALRSDQPTTRVNAEAALRRFFGTNGASKMKVAYEIFGRGVGLHYNHGDKSNANGGANWHHLPEKGSLQTALKVIDLVVAATPYSERDSAPLQQGLLEALAVALIETPLLEQATDIEKGLLIQLIPHLERMQEEQKRRPLVIALVRKFVESTASAKWSKKLTTVIKSIVRHAMMRDHTNEIRDSIRGLMSEHAKSGRLSVVWNMFALLPADYAVPTDLAHALLLGSCKCSTQDISSNIARVLAALPDAEFIEGMLDHPHGLVPPFSDLLRVAEARPWLALYLHKMSIAGNTDLREYTERWQTVMQNTPGDDLVMRTLALLPATSPLYLRTQRVRREKILSRSSARIHDLVMQMLEVVRTREKVIEDAVEPTLFSFVCESLQALDGFNSSDVVHLTGDRTQDLQAVDQVLSRAPFKERAKETKNLALLSMRVGDWVLAAGLLRKLIVSRPGDLEVSGWAEEALAQLGVLALNNNLSFDEKSRQRRAMLQLTAAFAGSKPSTKSRKSRRPMLVGYEFGQKKT